MEELENLNKKFALDGDSSASSIGSSLVISAHQKKLSSYMSKPAFGNDSSPLSNTASRTLTNSKPISSDLTISSHKLNTMLQQVADQASKLSMSQSKSDNIYSSHVGKAKNGEAPPFHPAKFKELASANLSSNVLSKVRQLLPVLDDQATANRNEPTNNSFKSVSSLNFSQSSQKDMQLTPRTLPKVNLVRNNTQLLSSTSNTSNSTQLPPIKLISQTPILLTAQSITNSNPKGLVDQTQSCICKYEFGLFYKNIKLP